MKGVVNYCPTFWGSHGCDKARWHELLGDPVHQCGTDVEDEDDPNYNGGPCTQMIVLGPDDEHYKINDEEHYVNAAIRYYIWTDEDEDRWGSWAPSRWFS